MNSLFFIVKAINFVPSFLKLVNGYTPVFLLKFSFSLMLLSFLYFFNFQFLGTLQKNLGPASLQYNQSLGGSSLQSPLIFSYPNTVFGTSPMLGNTQTAQNVSSGSQLLGSPLVQPR